MLALSPVMLVLKRPTSSCWWFGVEAAAVEVAWMSPKPVVWQTVDCDRYRVWVLVDWMLAEHRDGAQGRRYA